MTDHSTIQAKAEQHALKMAQREAQNGFEYEYEIDAVSGAIVKQDKDIDD